ncbi:MAG TPA: cupin domain-containing protein [Thermoanaerobaculia bacterium]|nr:cupin domain-containing protein [Thermoanaerobaculia bacterium]
MSEPPETPTATSARSAAGKSRAATVLRAAEVAARAQSFSHPWNPASEVTGARMSELAGLSRTGVSRVRVDPGKESFADHAHHFEEEWIYILSGRAVVRIDGVEHGVGPGDFVGFPTPSQAHQLVNRFDEPVEYLMGGESREFEVADFPTLNRRMLRFAERVEVVPLDAAEPLVFTPPSPAPDAAAEDER